MVLAMLLAHLVADYVLQWDRLAIWKSREVKGVMAHGLIVLIVTWIFSLPFDVEWWPWVIFIWLTHTTVDLIRLRLGGRFSALGLYLLDQAVHFSLIAFALVASGYLLPINLGAQMMSLFDDQRWLLYALGYVFATMPAWILLRFVVYGLTGAPPDFSQTPNKYMSSLERGLIVTFVVLGQFVLVPLAVLPRFVLDGPRMIGTSQSTLYVTEWLASISLALIVGLWLQQV